MADPKQYVRLKHLLQEKITSGGYSPGDRFYSQTELMKRYGLSFSTVIRAMDELVREGYLVRKQGKGTFVARVEPGAPAVENAGWHVSVFTRSDTTQARSVPLDVLACYRHLDQIKPEGMQFRFIPLMGAEHELEPYLFTREPMDAVVCIYPTEPQTAVLDKMCEFLPVVRICEQPQPAGGARFYEVITDVGAAVDAATTELIGRGHSNVGLLLPAEADQYGAACAAGYRAALRRASVAFRESLIEVAAPSDLNGYHATLNLVDKNSDMQVTALVASSGELLSGAAFAAQSMGLSASANLTFACLCGSVTGTPVSGLEIIRVGFPPAAVASACLELLQRGLRGQPPEALSVPPVVQS
jgi:DNA-binding LacI/PurR family transcriptional regulator